VLCADAPTTHPNHCCCCGRPDTRTGPVEPAPPVHYPEPNPTAPNGPDQVRLSFCPNTLSLLSPTVLVLEKEREREGGSARGRVSLYSLQRDHRLSLPSPHKNISLLRFDHARRCDSSRLPASPFSTCLPPPRPLLLLGFPTPPPPDPEPDGARSHGAAAGVQLRYDASASAAQIRPRSAARVSFLVFTGSLFLPVPAADPLYPELWRACAGPLVTVPRPGDLVYYFPQGHIEQVRLHTPPPPSSCCLPLMFREPSLISCCCVRVR
jgi:hypothetical protein